MKRAINIPVDTARLLAKNPRNDLNHPKMILLQGDDKNSIVEVIADIVPYYILTYGGKVLSYASFLPDSKLKTLLSWAGKGISALAGYWHIKEKGLL